MTPAATTQSSFTSFSDLSLSLGRRPPAGNRPVVCVQGLGFVGAAMAVAVARARNSDGTPCFDVIGVELATPEGLAKVRDINQGRLPMVSSDGRLDQALAEAHACGNLVATTNELVYRLASVTVVDVPIDLVENGSKPTVRLDGFRQAIRTLGRFMEPGGLIVVETTVPPGTSAKVVAPELAAALEERGLPPDSLLLAHSYERVMPGNGYLDSIANFWRPYAGHTEEAADACEDFLSRIINTNDYPLTRLHSTTASETAKVLENSYRATTIALMEEWGRFAEAVGVDLFEVISAIRQRPTHSNMRQPGFGVGGYCLTKDPLFASIGARELFGIESLDFPFSSRAVTVNKRMPFVSLDKLEALLGDMHDKTILLMGISYRPDIGDTRQSPSETFVRAARERGATVLCHDPLLSRWPELALEIHQTLPSLVGIDAVVFAVQHSDYEDLDFRAWLEDTRPVFLDANDVLTREQRMLLDSLGCAVTSIGRGSNL
jgi:UDP-N-acetyl-D-glucosamine dehydrogenase